MVYCLNPECLELQDATATNFCRDCGSTLTLAGRYRAEAVIGESSFGRTLVAIDAAQQRCVIKQSFRRADAFEQDARRLRKLGEHPQIPTVLDVVENELGQFLIQEFVEGENLQRRVEEKGPLDEGEVRSLLKSLLSVLEYVHSFKIIHRDIKPSNIILNGNNPPVLVDFGAAKSLRTSSAKTVIGSADYAAPEQSMGQATFASDVYSLGVTCLYALTSVAPFTLYSASEDRWVWKDYLAQPVDSAFADVLDKMVAQPVQARFDSAAAVAIAFQNKRLPSFLPNKFLPNKFLPNKLVSNDLIARAKESAAPLVNALPSNLRPKPSAPSLRPAVIAAQTWKKEYRITDAGGLVSAIALPPLLQQNIFATASTDGSIRLWNLADGQLIHMFPRRRFMGEGHSATVTALCFHPDGRALYSASEDGTIKEWDSVECCLLNTLPMKGWMPTDLKVTADGFQLMSPNSDGQIVVWDIATLLPAVRLTQHQKRVNAIALSAGAMASASDDGTVKLWRCMRDEQNSQAEQNNKLLFARTVKTEENVRFLSFYTKDAQKQLVVVTQNEAKRYRLDFQLNASAPQHLYASPDPITAFAFLPDGYLMLGTEERFLTIWDVDTGDCVAELEHDWGVVAIACSSAGRKMVTASADGVITVWSQVV
ncbi:MAG: serine/threonine-protein kinase [Cyanobacteria bacterium P01_D01_bin.105]